MRRAVLLAILFVAVAGPASAEPTVLQTGTSPVININLRSGSITIKTWNRNAVQVDAGAGVNAQHLDANVVAGRIPRQMPAWSQSVKTPRGDAILSAEVWILPRLATVSHDAVVVRGDGDATLTVPSGAAFISARAIGRGSISLDGYRDGAFFLSARVGGIDLHDVSGTGFVQTVRGPIDATASSFERLRARNAIGLIFFSDCAARQIEVTSVFGSVIYDNGTFVPGLARFESQNGDVALGISGDAQIGAHSATGTVQTEFTGRAEVQGSGGDARASIGSGGAAVTASSGSGMILLYDGSLRDHANLVRRVPRIRSVFAKHPKTGWPARARRSARPPYRV
ncbi:MAG: hypothetical protein M3R30_01975 [Candidatus Eremiobacteraeota bacterium]|nr:hypothetical protein [Candidatus Eremiobacteraeota bacterium]